jgi:quinoprotein glucose dehydrogenase
MRGIYAWALGASLLGSAVLAPALLAQTDPTAAPAPQDWPRYARDLGGTRYSPLDQINRQNVDSLDSAWSVRLRPEGGGGLLGGTVPIVIDGTMYLPTGNAVIALEAHTGRELWRHPVEGGLVRRSVTWWAGEGNQKPRIYFATGPKIFALDAATGKPASGFGTGGSIDIDGSPWAYPPTIYKNVMVIGASVAEMPQGPSGNTRAYDVRTGKKLWEFNSVPQPGEVGHETWLDDGWKDRSGANMWVWYTTADPATDTIYMTLGSPSANYYGGDRPGANLFGNSLVAVDAQTGKYKWHFQTIHHDLWDWDLPAPPTMVNVTKDGKTIPALSLTGKPGLMYILNRETGEPVHGVNEMLVSPANVPGEWYSPTQPIPVLPKPLNRMHWTPEDIVTAEDTTPEHVAACHALLESYGGTFYNAGPFTPFFLQEEGAPPRASINMPHNGGSNWGGTAADPRGILYLNTSEGGSIGWIEKRKPGGDYGRGTADSTQQYDRGSLIGPGAYSGFQAAFKGPDGRNVSLPCIRPPWGRLLAVDGNSGEILWASRLGLSEGLPEGKQETGAINFSGGPIVTEGGLIFIGATSDRRFRAFDRDTGKILWEKELPYAPQTVPITYRGKDGRQYVAVIAAGAGLGGPAARGPDGKPLNGESVFTFALPK